MSRKHNEHITKREYEALGGMTNRDLFRVQIGYGNWLYYKICRN
jgi:hypothetical protein